MEVVNRLPLHCDMRAEHVIGDGESRILDDSPQRTKAVRNGRSPLLDVNEYRQRIRDAPTVPDDCSRERYDSVKFPRHVAEAIRRFSAGEAP